MKKKLEAELISIAHRILKLKNKSELHQLQQEAQNLYEKLTLLQFVENHFAEAKPTIGRSEIEDKIQAAFEPKEEELPVSPIEETVAETPEVNAALPQSEAEEEKAVEEEHQPEVIEPVAEGEATPEITEAPEQEKEIEPETASQEEPAEEAEVVSEEATEESIEEEEEEEKETPVAAEDNSFKPAFELAFDTKDEEIAEEIKKEIKNVSPQIAFDDLLGPDYKDPVFVKPEDLEKEKANNPANVIPIGRSYNDAAPVISLNKDQNTSLNDRMSKGIIIGLNDRIAFMTHLFANSSEDYNRVLSQLMTFGTYTEAKDFIDNMVKPDYNNWEGKDEYAERFMEIIEKRFS